MLTPLSSVLFLVSILVFVLFHQLALNVNTGGTLKIQLTCWQFILTERTNLNTYLRSDVTLFRLLRFRDSV